LATVNLVAVQMSPLSHLLCCCSGEVLVKLSSNTAGGCPGACYWTTSCSIFFFITDSVVLSSFHRQLCCFVSYSCIEGTVWEVRQ